MNTDKRLLAEIEVHPQDDPDETYDRLRGMLPDGYVPTNFEWEEPLDDNGAPLYRVGFVYYRLYGRPA